MSTASPPDAAARIEGLVSFLAHEPQPAIVLDPDYTILAVNPAYQKQFATGPHDVGRKCYRVSHHYDVPCDQAGEHCPMRKARETRQPDRVLHIHHTPRGPEHVDVELRPILDEQGAIVAYVERLTAVRTATTQAGGEGLVGSAPAFNQALEQVQRVAPSMLPVLLQGESGTGKELFARAVHAASARAAGPFVVVDCSGLSETLLESELFGYERGAFTGALARKAGLVETAEGGTLFLDELGDVPPAIQVKLLRLIESRTYRRVGSVETRSADFRLVAATHKPLHEMVEDGRFRKDLYYRLNAFPIRLPALRERREDVGLLARALLRRAASDRHYTLSPDAEQALRAHDWPGNIRELRNVMERAILFTDDGVIRLADLPPAIVRPAAPVAHAASQPGRPPAVALDDAALARADAAFTGTRKALARELGLSERTLYRRLKAIGRL